MYNKILNYIELHLDAILLSTIEKENFNTIYIILIIYISKKTI